MNTQIYVADSRSTVVGALASGTDARPPWSRTRLRLILTIAVALAAAILGCSSDGEPTPYDRNIFTPVPGPPPLPVIFEGKFTVAGKPGPAGQIIYAEFIHGGSPYTTTFEGDYVKVILGPVSVDDIEFGAINFYLGTRDGDHVKADQSWEWSRVNQPTNQVLDLTFPRLPES